MSKNLALSSVIVLFSAILASACQPASSTAADAYQSSVLAKQTSSSEHDSLLSLDFSDMLAQCDVVTIDDDDEVLTSTIDKLILESLRLNTRNRITGDLTADDKSMLGVWMVPGERTYHVLKSNAAFGVFYRKHGRLPESGVDYMATTYPMGSDRDWTQKSPTQLFMAAFPVINLQTGKLYGTFTAEQWAPGEMTIEVVDDPAEFANYGKTEMITDPLNRPGAEKVEPGSLWVFRLYGATPGSIVFTDVQARLAE